MRMPPGVTAAGERLDFAEGLLGLYDGDDPRRALWGATLGRARRRLAEQHYHLAVLGAFSSGKSTFINALLEIELLASGIGETTAAVVHISYGRRFTLRVGFRDGDRWEGEGPVPVGEGRLRPVRAATAARAVHEVKRALDVLPLRDALRTVTTDPAVAPLVASVRVELPSPLLASGLVLIDTPGAESTRGYADLTRQAIADADAAVVVNQQSKVLPESMAAFLTEELDDGLRARCVFVVTRADDIEPDELDPMDAAARRRIGDHLGVDPDLAWVAPLHVVRSLRPEGAATADRVWVERFELTRTWLRRVTELRRPSAVADTALRVVSGALAELEQDLGEYRDGLERRRVELDAATPADMNELLARQVETGLGALTAERASLGTDLQRDAENTLAGIRERMHEAMKPCANAAQVRQVLTTDIAPWADTRLRVFLDMGADRVHRRIGGCLDSVLADLRAAFMLAYDALRRIDTAPRAELARSDARGGALDMRPAAHDFVAAEAFLAADGRRDVMSIGGGFGAGALIGSFLLPGVGTVLGGIIGGFLGGHLFVRDMETVRDEAVTRAYGPLEDAVSDIVDHLLEAADGLVAQAESELRGRARWYRDTYADTVAALHRAHRAEQETLTERSRALAEGHAEAVAHRAEVARERARLRGVAALTTTDHFGGLDD
ncbi:dynamin family protein [Nocardiopsis sp. CC223A]|uniref:dynamin family protein n=1 Tax=Nocardiopsis sp. CC223A TaxID=3044051 RepID=UPI00278C8ACC|nr:dynamin family protein [Nocardiopsis sp. CC223A]